MKLTVSISTPRFRRYYMTLLVSGKGEGEIAELMQEAIYKHAVVTGLKTLHKTLMAQLEEEVRQLRRKDSKKA